MIKTIDFNGLAAGTIVDNEYLADCGVTVSAEGGSGDAIIQDSVSGDGGALIVSDDGASSEAGGCLFFDFSDDVRMKSITFIGNEEPAELVFLDAEGNVIETQYVVPTAAGETQILALDVTGVAQVKVVLNGPGAVDDLIYDDLDTTGGNSAPVANDDAADTGEGAAVTVDVLANDTDADGDTLTITDVTSADGTATDNGDGTVTFEPAPGFTGDATVTYTVSDGNGGTDTGTLTVTVGDGGGGNTAPVANDDTAVSPDGGPVTVDVLANDTDADGDDLSVFTFATEDGNVDVNDDGTITFTPNPGFVGEATILYAIEDGNGGTDGATLTVLVGDGGGAGGDGIVTGTAGGDVIDLAYDGDPEGDFIDNSDALLPGEAPQDDIVDAGTGDDTISAFEGDDDIYAGDGDDVVDGGTGDDVIYGDSNLPGGAFDGATTRESFEWDLAGVADEGALGGFVQDTGNTNVTFTILSETSEVETEFSTDTQFIDGIETDGAAADANSSLDSETRGEGQESVYQLGFDNPVTNVDFRINDVDGDGVVRVLAYDADGNQIPVTLTGGSNVTLLDTDGVAGADTADSNGGYQPDSNGTYSVLVGIEGPVSRIVIEHSQDGGNNSGINVTDVYFDADGGVVTDEPGNDDLSGGAGDDLIFGEGGDDTLTGGAGSDTLNGGDDMDLINGGAGDVVDGGAGGFNADDALNTDFDTLDLTGQGPFVLEDVVADSNGNGTNGTVVFVDAGGVPTGETISYTEIEEIIGDNVENNDPIANDDTVTTDEDAPVTIPVLANDSDPDGDPLTVTDATSPDGEVVINDDGTVTFTPAPDFNGDTTITYTIDDGNGGTDTATVDVTVTPVNDAPVANDDADTTDEDTAITVDLLANDTDLDGDDLTVTAVSVPADQGTLVGNGDGTVTFTPAPDFNGEATISYTIADPDGATDSAEHAITVTPVNDAPVANDDSDETDEEVAITVDLLANDTDVDGDDLTVTDATVPADQGTLVDNGDGTVTFTPAPDFTGIATISYTIEDEEGLTDSAVHTIDVGNVNDDPIAVDDTATTDEDTTVTIPVLANDSDPDLDPLTVTEATSPDGDVVINDDGTIDFTPNPDFNGDAVITYTIDDGNGGTDTATVDVTVTPVNDAPVANDDADITDEDTAITVDLLANDTDADGDDLMVVDASVPADQGTLVDNGDGTVTFTPAPDFNGTATISYTIEDEEGLQDSAVHTIDVGAVNDAPIANDDSDTGIEDTPVIVNLLANDSDPDLDALTVVEATVPASQGTIADNGDGTWTFTPAPDFNGVATISYTIEDEEGLQDSAIHTVDLTPVNDAPVANDDVDVTAEDTPITVDLLANDTDVEGDDLTVTAVSVPADQGTIVNNGDGTATFTPNPDFVGEVTISYSIADEEGLTDSAEHTVYVNEVSDGPVAVDDAAETPEDTPVTIDVLDNDSDPDGDDLIIASATVPAEQGTVEIVDGQIVFTPAEDFNGEATIDYVAQDPDGSNAPAQVIVTVTPVNDAPDAVDDSDITDLNTPITVNLLANDTDADFDPLTVADVSVPADQGTIVDNGDGTVTFTPATDFQGEATITYTIEDPDGAQDSAVHTVTVNDPDNAPTANDDTAVTDEDTPVTIDVLDNDTDPTDDPLTITSATVPADQGTVEIVDGELVFTPAPDFNGEATITYTIEDPDGNAAEAIATVTVNPVNDAPDAVDDEDSTDFGTPVTVDLLANDTDPEGDTLAVVDATVPADQGTLVDNGDGTVTFTPADGFEGDATITYTIEDTDGVQDTAVHTVTVGDNDSPIATDDVADTDEDTAVTIDLIGNDTDPNGDPLTLAEATVPEEQGTLVDNGDGTVTFTPAPDFNGDATITYTVSDPYGETDEGEAVVTVNPVNDAPIANDDSDVTDAGEPVTIDLLANDSDPDGDALAVVEAEVPADQGTLIDNGDGTFIFTPADGFLGEATITYTISDPLGVEATAVHTVTVNDADSAPVAEDDTATTDEDTPVTIDVLDNDSDPDGDDLTIVSVSVPEDQGTVEIVDGEVVFTPAPDFEGEATISYTVEDPDGNADEAAVSVTVNPVNDDPIANDDTATTEEDTDVVIDLIDNDSDPEGDMLTVTAVSVPADQGTIVDNGDGTATFTPAPDFVGEATVTYTITDGNGGEDTATHVVDVTPVNDAPTAVDDVAATDEDTPVTIDLVGNDTDPDGDVLTLKDASVPAEQGTLVDNGDGTVTFTPAPDFNGEATITYTICDEAGVEDTGSATVTVNPVNDAPVAADDTATTVLEEPVTIDVLANDTDPDGDPLEVKDATVPASQGTVVVNADNTVTFTPVAGFDGQATITYTICDPDGLEDTATVTVNVQDGIVSGTDDGELIDADYSGDPGGDLVDNDDALLPGEDGDDDIILAGGGDDTILAGDGDDEVSAGSGDDSVDAGTGDDSVDGGSGDDTIEGGDGDDTLRGNLDDDLLEGGDGNDLLDGGGDDDTLNGGAGDDSLQGATGDDELNGGDGDDSLDGGQGTDTLDGGAGADILTAGLGDDVLNGGDGDDTMLGGSGNDTFDGGDGNDSMTGGADEDVFINVNAGDVVDGSETGEDFDCLDLTGSAPVGGSLEVEYADDNPENGTVFYFDEDNNPAGQLVFTNIEKVVPCFTPGTKIATPKGEMLVEELKVGDRVITRDNGIREIRWVGHKEMTGEALAANEKMRPVLIRAGALGDDLPMRDMMVSPNHRMLVANDKTALYFEEREVLVAAKHLTDLEGVDIVDVSGTTYIHVMFDNHEVILSDGTWTESFQPGDNSLAGVGDAQREEILELFPELATREGVDGYTSARRSLKKHEAKLLTK